MKAVQIESFGVPHTVAACVDVDDPGAPGPGEVVVDVEAFPINPVDLLTIEGRYATRPPLPAVPGSEGVGTVAQAGSGVDDVTAGDRVLLLGRGNWTQRLRVDAQAVLKLPAEMDVLQLAMLKINPATALMMLREYVALKPGEWLIQDAANSAVGSNLIGLARASGVKTVNIVRRESAVAPLLAAGAEAVVVDSDDLAAKVAEAAGGAQIRLAIDAIAGDMCLRLADCLADGGTLVNYGKLSGEACQISGDHLVFRGITLTGFWLGGKLPHMSQTRLADLYGELVGRVLDGTINVAVEATYGIDDIEKALEHAGRSGRDGKILVTPNAAG